MKSHARYSCKRNQVMSTQPGTAPLYLKTREILDIHDGEGLAVKCLHGVLWITQSNDTDDIVIHAGQSFVLDRPGLALVSAPIGPADVVVQAAAERACSIEQGRAA
jgi:hypothetical protein